MQTGRIVWSAFRTAADRWGLMLVVYLTMQTLSVAILVPSVSLLVNLAVQLSAQSALTDQDIAMFLLSPVGFVVGLGVLSVVLAVQIASFAIMATIVRLPSNSAPRLLGQALSHVAGRFRPLTGFAFRLILRVLALIAPFAAIAGWVALQNLTEYDINYYLTNRPPEFLRAVASIGVVVFVLAIILLRKLSDWAVAAHLVLFDQCRPSQCFKKSRVLMAGERRGLQAELVVWFAVRVIAVQVMFVVMAAIFRLMPFGPDANLNTVVFFVFVVTALWLFSRWVIGAMSLGALAVLLDTRFGPASDALGGGQDRSVSRNRIGLAAVLAACAAGIALWISQALLDAVNSEETVEVIAHRGAAGTKPENTMAAIQQALKDQADWVEIDVQESLDGQVVVIHDADFMKLSGNPVKVWEADYEELSQIDIGSWYDPAYSEERPPLLSEVLAAAKGRSKVLIELKHYGHAVDLEQRVIEQVEAAGMVEHVALMSLKYPSVQKAHTLRPDWRVGVLAASAVGDMSGLDGDFLAVRTAVASPRFIRNTHAAGKDVYVWTVNDPLQMSQVMSQGVDGIITDEPALAREVIKARSELNSAERIALWLATELGLATTTPEYRDDSP